MLGRIPVYLLTHVYPIKWCGSPWNGSWCISLISITQKMPKTKNWEHFQCLLRALSTCSTLLHADLHLFVCQVIGPPMSISLFYMYNSIFSSNYLSRNKGYYQLFDCLSIYLVSSQLVQKPLLSTLLHYWSKAFQSDISKCFWVLTVL